MIRKWPFQNLSSEDVELVIDPQSHAALEASPILVSLSQSSALGPTIIGLMARYVSSMTEWGGRSQPPRTGGDERLYL